MNLGVGTSATLSIAFGLVGVALARLWARLPAVPHALDMAFGMLTVGNLGMVLGWWADQTSSAADGCDCCCASAAGLVPDPSAWLGRPWMWVGMLAAANLAMILLPRRPRPRTAACQVATFGGGNLGMVAGMLAGGWGCGALIPDPGVFVHYLAMSAGMVAGMFLGHLATHQAFLALRLGGTAAPNRRVIQARS
jgi:hypothetical protein